MNFDPKFECLNPTLHTVSKFVWREMSFLFRMVFSVCFQTTHIIKTTRKNTKIVFVISPGNIFPYKCDNTKQRCLFLVYLFLC